MCLDAQFVWGTVGVPPLPSRLRFEATAIQWAAAALPFYYYFIMILKTQKLPITCSSIRMLGCSPPLRPVLASILYSRAPKLSRSFRWLFSPFIYDFCSSVVHKVYFFATEVTGHFVLHFSHQTVLLAVSCGGGVAGCRTVPVHGSSTPV